MEVNKTNFRTSDGIPRIHFKVNGDYKELRTILLDIRKEYPSTRSAFNSDPDKIVAYALSPGIALIFCPIDKSDGVESIIAKQVALSYFHQ